MSRRIALIPAAGVGERFGAGKPKQYAEINGKTVLEHTLGIFLQHAQIDRVAVVLSPDDAFFQTACLIRDDRLTILRCGGTSRAESVRNGIDALLQQGLATGNDRMLVHDAARCCLPSEALTRLIETVGDDENGGILAVPVADTLKRADANNRTAETVSRERLWQAQTPQMFQTALLQRALSGGLDGITDEASAVERLGFKPRLVQGDVRNLKLTLPQDEIIMQLLLSDGLNRKPTNRKEIP